MSETAILLNIGDMIDLAIGSPEVGVVDFCMLQTVLHCLAQQMHILGKNVELRGTMAGMPTGRENTQTIDIKEYSVDISDEVPTKKDELPTPPPPAAETILVVERVRRSVDAADEFPKVYVPSESPRASQAMSKKQTGASKKGSRPTDPPYVTLSKFNLLERTVGEITGHGPLEKAVHKLEQAVDEMRAQREHDTQIQPTIVPSDTTSEYKELKQTINQLEDAIHDMKARRPSDSQAVVTQNTNNVLEKAVALLEQSVDDIKAQRTADEQQNVLTSKNINMLEKALGMLEKAVDEVRAQPPSVVESQPTDTRAFVTVSKFNMLENAVDEIRAQRPSGPAPDQQSRPADIQNLVTLSKFNVLEKAVDEIRAQRPIDSAPDQKSQPADTQNLVTLSKFNVLEKAVDEIRAQRPIGSAPDQKSRPADTQNLVTLSKFNVLEKAFDEIRAQRPIGSAPDQQSRPADTQNLVTLSKFNVLEKAVDDIRRQPTRAPSLTIPHEKLTVLEKSVEVLEKAINEIKDNRHDEPAHRPSLTGKITVLERAVEILGKAVEEIRVDQPTEEPQKSLVTLSKFNLLEKAVNVLEKTIGEVKDKPPVIQTQPDSSKGQTISLVTLSKFNLLKQTVADIQDRVFSSVPKNEALLEDVRSQTNIKAIQEMWQSLNVQSRLEAAEVGLGKLSSLVEDLISESAELQKAVQKHGTKKQESTTPAPPPPVITRPPRPEIRTPVAPPAASSQAPPAAKTSRPRSPGPTPGATKDDIKAIKAHLQGLQADVDTLMGTFFEIVDDMKNDTENELGPGPEPAEAGGTEGSGTPVSEDKSRRLSALAQGLGDRVNSVEKRMVDCCDTIGKVEGIVQDQLNSFQDQLEYLLKQVGGISTELASGKLSPDLVKDLQGLMALFQTVQDMQVQLKKVHDTALQLASEKDDRQQYLNSLLEQIDLLKVVKLDREDMLEAMADKADLGMLARKVSHDRFESACDDLSKGLETALGKLNLQEALWQQALDDIQREIETKLDKMELSPVKAFFNSKLQLLQENLKQMASLRKEAEAAGTKRRLLRDVNCISCDARAVMAMDVANPLPLTKPLPANLSMKPYLSYELDSIRKSQQVQGQMPGTRNMHDWENIDKQMTPAKPLIKVRSDTDKHLCNRYCGGSHTVTTPSQRVARLGHFIKQWGPDVLPLSSGMAAGDDGRMYRVTAGEKGQSGTGVVGPPPEPANTPRPTKKPEASKTADSRPISAIFPECRCLESAEQKAKK